jgi:hypothetical protein
VKAAVTRLPSSARLTSSATKRPGTRPVPCGEAPRAFGPTHASGPRARDVVACERKVP